MSENIVLKMSNISKTFPGVKALSNVDFTLREGEIHALMGENGAGKSTLIKVLTGVHDFQTGEIYMVKNAGGKPELIVKSFTAGSTTKWYQYRIPGSKFMSESYGCRKLVYRQRAKKIWYDRLAYNESEVSRGFKESRYPCGTNSEIWTSVPWQFSK